MQELVWTPSTVVLVVVIAVLAAMAVRRMMHRGLCDCGDHCGDGDGAHSACSGCPSCSGGASGCPAASLCDDILSASLDISSASPE